MKEFKGTNELWFMSGTEIVSMPSQVKICKVFGRDYDEAKYNALLISNAREMLEMLNDIKDYLGSDKRQEVEQLIKEITTL